RCLRRFYDRAIDIRGVKRFLAGATATPRPASAAAPARVAIVGAGPAGLACAFFLRRAGVEVDLFDRAAGPGGLAAAVIPLFRLEPDSLRLDLDRILASGIRPHWGESIDEPRFASLLATCDFVFVGSGAGPSRKLGVPGDDLPGVVGALEFLAASRSDPAAPGQRIAVIGGGNSAIDAARAARRLAGPGANVKLLYRRGRAEMPAEPEEIAAALAEGIELVERVAPFAVERKPAGGLSLRLAATRSAPRGQDVIVDPDATVLPLQPADLVIVATGQLRSIPFLPGVVMPKGTGPAWIGERILAGGDARRGPATVASAVGDGRQAAALFLERLSRTPAPDAAPIPGVAIPAELLVRRARRERLAPLPLPAAGPDGLCPSPAVLTRAEAEAEAGRCLECDRVCDLCVSVCPNRANLAYESERVSLPRWRLTRRDGRIEPVAAGTLEIAQGRQVFHLAEACNGCGNCDTFCPTAGSPHHDKPTFHLTAGRFAAAERGYRWANDSTLEGKTPIGETFTLVRTGDGWRLTLPAAEITFDGTLTVTRVTPKTPWDELDLSFAAEALALHRALCGRFPIPPAG
ncbi:MAG TPA: FAD-dependent oxidoreductase, partial [Candidatus Aminicenantes bacterium]|nr:FAD-dependent oxidoreductase [Candidatus Aminicenantes bacterium]